MKNEPNTSQPDERDDLADPASWEFTDEPASPQRPPRAVVSVAFSRADFERVESYAREHGQKISEAIREAVLARVAGVAAAPITLSGGGSGSFFFERMPSHSAAPGAVTENESGFLVGGALP